MKLAAPSFIPTADIPLLTEPYLQHTLGKGGEIRKDQYNQYLDVFFSFKSGIDRQPAQVYHLHGRGMPNRTREDSRVG